MRIEIEPYSVTPATTWIAEAQGNGYHVIATYHKSTALGSNDQQEMMQPSGYFIEIYGKLVGV